MSTGTARRRGFTLIELLSVITLIAILASLALPNMLSSRKQANETSAVSAIRDFARSQEIFRLRHGNVYGTLEQLNTDSLLPDPISAGSKSGYAFTVNLVGPHEFNATAVPVGLAGDRSFFVDQSGVIRVEEGAAATAASPPLN